MKLIFSIGFITVLYTPLACATKVESSKILKRVPSSVEKSIACEADKTIGEGEGKPVTFSIDVYSPGQVSPNKNTVELKLNDSMRAKALLGKEMIFFETMYRAETNEFSIDLYDEAILVPGDAKPRILNVGGQIAASETSLLSFSYEQWAPIPSKKPRGYKRHSNIYSFSCSIGNWPQHKFYIEYVS